MFEMIAFVFLVVTADQPGNTTEPALPPLVYTKQTFDSEEVCENYFDTEEGAVAKNKLMSFVSQALDGRSFTLGIKCVPKEDNSI
jgi:hypothetical protein